MGGDSKVQKKKYEEMIGFMPEVVVVLSAGTIFSPEDGVLDGFRSTRYDEGDTFGTLFGEGRVRAAAELAVAFPGAKLITTSKRLPGEPTHAQIVRKELAALSVDAERIVLEERSINTLSQIAEALRIIFHTSWKNVVFVTSEYQLVRTKLFYEHLEELLAGSSQYADIIEEYRKIRIQVAFIPAEYILTCVSREFATMIDTMKKTNGYKMRLENEARGVQSILNGTYTREKLQDKFERNV